MSKCRSCGRKTEHAECEPADVRRHQANVRRAANRRAREEALRSCGLTKARDSAGRTI